MDIVIFDHMDCNIIPLVVLAYYS